MAMFPSYGKSRFEIAFVFPSVDGPYKERKARGEIVPRNRWVDKLLCSEQQQEPQHDEPDYDLPTESIPPSPHPSRSEAPHEDEGTAQPKHRM